MVENRQFFSYPFAFDAPVRGGSSRNSATLFGVKKTRMAWLPDGEKISKIFLFERDRQTDRRTDTACRQ